MAYRVLVTPTTFAKNDPTPADLLVRRGFELVRNTTGRPFTKAEMLEAMAGMDAVIVGTDPMDAEVMDRAPALRVISKFGVGVNNIDLDHAKKRGIAVTRTVGANADAVADSALALMLAVTKDVVRIDAEVRQGLWLEYETFEMNRKTLGLIGLGNIGKGVAKRASGFDMRILAYDAVVDADFATRFGVEYVPLERILRESDFLSLHLPLLPETRHILGAREISWMKPGAVLVNTARGGLIDEEALLAALKTGRIRGAGLDVFESEPLENPDWFSLPNVVLSPHSAADTYEATHAMSLMAARNVLEHWKP